MVDGGIYETATSFIEQRNVSVNGFANKSKSDNTLIKFKESSQLYIFSVKNGSFFIKRVIFVHSSALNLKQTSIFFWGNLYSVLEIRLCTFTQNKSDSSSLYYAFIFINNYNVNLTISNSVFNDSFIINNSSLMIFSANFVDIIDTKFHNISTSISTSTLQETGGGMTVNALFLNVSSTSFSGVCSNNYGCGGGICVLNSTNIFISRSSFESCNSSKGLF
jgi:hypothetical protein